MISRRRLVSLLPMTTLPSFARKPAHAGCQTNAWKLDPSDPSQFLTVLGRIRALGFEGFETSFRNLQLLFANPGKAKADIGKTGLRFFGAHIFLLDYDAETSLAPWDLIV